jgi:hypothetical protein
MPRGKPLPETQVPFGRSEDKRMEIYHHPVSTTSRPLMLFASESGIDVDFQIVDLLAGECACPKDLRQRAKINEMMDWINTQICRDFACGLAYLQIFHGQHRRPGDKRWDKVHEVFYSYAGSMKDVEFEVI